MTQWTVACQVSLSFTISWNLPKFMSTGDANQPSHSLSPSSPSAFNLCQHQGLFQRASCLHQVAQVSELQLQHQSFQRVLRSISLRLTGLSSLLSKGLLVCDVCDINSRLQLWIAFLGLFMSLSLPLISAPDGQRWGLTQSSSASVMSAIW